MTDLVCSLPHWEHYSIILIVAIVEMWLGKTDKLKSASIIELIINIIVSMMKRVFKKE